jgi:hypothetical protein
MKLTVTITSNPDRTVQMDADLDEPGTCILPKLEPHLDALAAEFLKIIEARRKAPAQAAADDAAHNRECFESLETALYAERLRRESFETEYRQRLERGDDF